MRVVLLGANGQLGRDLSGVLSHHEIIPFTREDFDVTDDGRTCAVLNEVKPNVIVNTTAYHRVDDCETQPERAFQCNALAVLHLARAATGLNALLVHFSTDYVFDGRSTMPYSETSPAMPLSVYGNSKLAGEHLVRAFARQHLIIRTCGLYGTAGSRGKGGNFVETMLKKARAAEPIQVVADQVLTPTYTVDLATQVVELIDRGDRGLFHCTSEGECSWFEFACAIFDIAGLKPDLSPTTTDAYRAPALRPRYSVLENARLKQTGNNRMRHWRDALMGYFEEKKSLAE